jgi:hypothetical protein
MFKEIIGVQCENHINTNTPQGQNAKFVNITRYWSLNGYRCSHDKYLYLEIGT